MTISIKMIYLIFAIIFIVLPLSLSAYIYSTSIIKENLRDVFLAVPINNLGILETTFKGVTGDSVKVFINPSTGIFNESIVENLDTNLNNSSSLKLKLQDWDLGRISYLARITPLLFRFNISMTNQIKKTADETIISCGINEKEPTLIKFEETKKIVGGVQFNNLEKTLNSLKCSLLSSGVMGDQFFDTEGNLKTKLSGNIIIKPDFLSFIYVALGIFVAIIVLFTLIQTTTNLFATIIKLLTKAP